MRPKSHYPPEALESIPGIGPSMAADLRDLGINQVSELKGKDPAELYELLEARMGTHVDRCVLYAYKCAVYYAEGGREPEKLKWWNWKDANA